MTVEIGILNKEAVAMAADSAVTISKGKRQKIFTSANKIFALSKYNPVGIMVFGSAELMGIPWETIIKIYRKRLGNTKFCTLKEYASNFIQFLNKNKKLFPESQQKNYFIVNARGLCYGLVKEIFDRVNEIIDKNGKCKADETLDITKEVITSSHKIWKELEFFPSRSKRDFTKLRIKYKNLIYKIKKDIFEKLPLSDNLSNKVTETMLNIFIKKPDYIQYDSGIVIAGFGEKDIFPSLVAHYVDGVIEDKLVYRQYKYTKISSEMTASIIPFAQQDVIATFMEGIAPSCEEEIRKQLSSIFELYPSAIIDNISKLSAKEKEMFKAKTKKIGKDMLKKYQKAFVDFQRKQFVDPVIGIVKFLPKDELAVMAETLINLTSFKRKVSEEAETVGGPIDVAVISKGDGFVWIKRKHYFKPELNTQFFENYKKVR